MSRGTNSSLLKDLLHFFFSIILIFYEFRQVLSRYDGDLRDPVWWPQESPVPMRVAQGPLGIPLPSMPGIKTMCGIGVGT